MANIGYRPRKNRPNNTRRRLDNLRRGLLPEINSLGRDLPPVQQQILQVRAELQAKRELAAKSLQQKQNTKPISKTPATCGKVQQISKTPAARGKIQLATPAQTKNAGSGNNENLCPIPQCYWTTSLKKHVMEAHLPSVFYEFTDKDIVNNSELSERRITGLRVLADLLLGPDAYARQLVAFLNENAKMKQFSMSKNALYAFGVLCNHCGWDVPKTFSVKPVNHPAALIHWSCMVHMLSFLDLQQRKAFIKDFHNPELVHRLPGTLPSTPTDQYYRRAPAQTDQYDRKVSLIPLQDSESSRHKDRGLDRDSKRPNERGVDSKSCRQNESVTDRRGSREADRSRQSERGSERSSNTADSSNRRDVKGKDRDRSREEEAARSHSSDRIRDRQKEPVIKIESRGAIRETNGQFDRAMENNRNSDSDDRKSSRRSDGDKRREPVAKSQSRDADRETKGQFERAMENSRNSDNDDRRSSRRSDRDRDRRRERTSDSRTEPYRNRNAEKGSKRTGTSKNTDTRDAKIPKMNPSMQTRYDQLNEVENQYRMSQQFPQDTIPPDFFPQQFPSNTFSPADMIPQEGSQGIFQPPDLVPMQMVPVFQEGGGFPVAYAAMAANEMVQQFGPASIGMMPPGGYIDMNSGRLNQEPPAEEIFDDDDGVIRFHPELEEQIQEDLMDLDEEERDERTSFYDDIEVVRQKMEDLEDKLRPQTRTHDDIPGHSSRELLRPQTRTYDNIPGHSSRELLRPQTRTHDDIPVHSSRELLTPQTRTHGDIPGHSSREFDDDVDELLEAELDKELYRRQQGSRLNPQSDATVLYEDEEVDDLHQNSARSGIYPHDRRSPVYRLLEDELDDDFDDIHVNQNRQQFVRQGVLQIERMGQEMDTPRQNEDDLDHELRRGMVRPGIRGLSRFNPEPEDELIEYFDIDGRHLMQNDIVSAREMVRKIPPTSSMAAAKGMIPSRDMGSVRGIDSERERVPVRGMDLDRGMALARGMDLDRGMVSDVGMVPSRDMGSDRDMDLDRGKYLDRGMVSTRYIDSDRGMDSARGMVSTRYIDSDRGMDSARGMVSARYIDYDRDMDLDIGMDLDRGMALDKGMVSRSYIDSDRDLDLDRGMDLDKGMVSRRYIDSDRGMISAKYIDSARGMESNRDMVPRRYLDSDMDLDMDLDRGRISGIAIISDRDIVSTRDMDLDRGMVSIRYKDSTRVSNRNMVQTRDIGSAVGSMGQERDLGQQDNDKGTSYFRALLSSSVPPDEADTVGGHEDRRRRTGFSDSKSLVDDDRRLSHTRQDTQRTGRIQNVQTSVPQAANISQASRFSLSQTNRPTTTFNSQTVRPLSPYSLQAARLSTTESPQLSTTYSYQASIPSTSQTSNPGGAYNPPTIPTPTNVFQASGQAIPFNPAMVPPPTNVFQASGQAIPFNPAMVPPPTNVFQASGQAVPFNPAMVPPPANVFQPTSMPPPINVVQPNGQPTPFNPTMGPPPFFVPQASGQANQFNQAMVPQMVPPPTNVFRPEIPFNPAFSATQASLPSSTNYSQASSQQSAFSFPGSQSTTTQSSQAGRLSTTFSSQKSRSVSAWGAPANTASTPYGSQVNKISTAFKSKAGKGRPLTAQSLQAGKPSPTFKAPANRPTNTYSSQDSKPSTTAGSLTSASSATYSSQAGKPSTAITPLTALRFPSNLKDRLKNLEKDKLQMSRHRGLERNVFGNTVRNERGTSDIDQKGTSDRDQRGTSGRDQRGTSDRDQRGTSDRDQRGTTERDQRGTGTLRDWSVGDGNQRSLGPKPSILKNSTTTTTRPPLSPQKPPRSILRKSLNDTKPSSRVYTGFDCYFHIDKLVKRINTDRGNVATKMEIDDIIKYKPSDAPSSHEVDFAGGVAVYNDPETFKDVEFPLNHKWKVAIGIDPARVKALNSDRLALLQSLLFNPLVSAVGGIGLDYTMKNTAEQEEALQRVLGLCTSYRPILLHIREKKKDPQGLDTYPAHQRCLEIVRDRVMPSQRILIHCYMGDTKTMTEWCYAFPNVMFSFSGKVSSYDRTQTVALKSIPLSKLMIETTAPYFSSRQFSTPADIVTVAQKVAAVKMVPVDVVLRESVKNATLFFRLGA